jgi:PilZ domain
LSWGIHNSLKGWTLHGLNDREMQLIIKTMSINEVKLTQVCRLGDSNWSPLIEKSYPELFKATSDIAGFPPLETRGKETNDTEFFIVRPKRTIQPRLHQRYEVAVQCQISSTNKQFTATTIDLSEGGLYFKETIPDWVAGYFLVGVQTQNAVYRLMCSMVEDQKERKRVQIVSEEQDAHYLAYKEWLISMNP